MIQEFVDRFMLAKQEMVAALELAHPESYDDLVSRVVKVCAGEAYYEVPDADRITVIDHGEYQGTRLYIIAAQGYQPSIYWFIFVSYGSCSVCDTFLSIRDYDDEHPTSKQANEYWTLMLHMVQSMAVLR